MRVLQILVREVREISHADVEMLGTEDAPDEPVDVRRELERYAFAVFPSMAGILAIRFPTPLKKEPKFASKQKPSHSNISR